jgi:hypothetical protein
MINKRRRWPTRISAALAALFVCTFVGCFGSIGTYNPGGGGGAGGGIVSRCCADGPPSGSVKINDTWSSTTCGSPTDSNARNSCTYEDYSDKPVGAIMDICNDQFVPGGWEPAPNSSTNPDGTYWSPTKCGSPPTISANMLKIKRTS